MTSLLRFPFKWGAVPDAPSTTTAVAAVATRWTNVSRSAKAWTEGISTPHRFERVYAQPRGVFGQSINFAFKVSSQFPFIVKSAFPVLITSTITNP